MEEYTRLNKELQYLQTQIAEKQWVEARLIEMEAKMANQKSQLAHLEEQLAKERADITALEGLSLVGLFYSILGNKDQQLEKERREALMAQLKYDEAQQSLALSEAEVEGLKIRMQRIHEAEEMLEVKLEIKLSLLLLEPTPAAQALKQRHTQWQALKKQKLEISEAFEAGKLYREILELLTRQLKSTQNWGTWDVMGGGMLSSYVKQQRLGDARKTLSSLRHYELKFRRELADIKQSLDLDVELTSVEGFLDVFFDNLITDWIVQQRINRSLAGAQKAFSQVGQVLDMLVVRCQQVDSQIEIEEYELKKKIVEAT
ncbi:hypothetical protein [Runella salmonicolor]|uniref:Uncharacterized protein n=1 Tax=Runella salmonicolor TaxID=2950278 RepID=A0ABT1FTD1_9BACT|nr:hypothetical protein [Runella salmonicolor]MCP1385028.1 hypothetical protein [Runella salmonicolor]